MSLIVIEIKDHNTFMNYHGTPKITPQKCIKIIRHLCKLFWACLPKCATDFIRISNLFKHFLKLFSQNLKFNYVKFFLSNCGFNSIFYLLKNSCIKTQFNN